MNRESQEPRFVTYVTDGCLRDPNNKAHKGAAIGVCMHEGCDRWESYVGHEVAGRPVKNIIEDTGYCALEHSW